jgi:hypothetical protein
MDYLRRLHPSHADRSSAARLDAPVTMAATVALPSATVEALALPPGEVRATVPDVAPLAASQPPLTGPSPRAAPLAEITASRAVSRRPPAAPATPSQPMQLTRSALPLSVMAARATPSSIDATAQPAQPAAAPLLMRAESPSSPAARRHEPSAVALALQPLRPEAVREREQATAAEPPPIIHVTIDRIDVRLPSTPAASTAQSRRRPASAVGGLGDYLRGRPPGGSA